MLAIALIISLLNIQILPSHAIYISVTNIKIDAQNETISMSVKVFSDDLEDAIHNHSGSRKKIIGNEDLSQVTPFIESYLDQKVSLQIGNENTSFKVTSCENIGDSTWIYLKSEYSSNPGVILLRNDLLYEIFDSQVNIVQLDIDDEKFYFKLSKEEPQKELSL